MKRRKPRLSFDARDYDITSLTREEDVALYKFKKHDGEREEEEKYSKTEQNHPFIYQSI